MMLTPMYKSTGYLCEQKLGRGVTDLLPQVLEKLR